jgi:hypothetical protein
MRLGEINSKQVRMAKSPKFKLDHMREGWAERTGLALIDATRKPCVIARSDPACGFGRRRCVIKA